MSQSYPSYSYVPGHWPHPFNSPEGHGFKLELDPSQPLDLVNWNQCEAYTAGVRLFNAGYYWEAHEAWELVWGRMGKHTLEGQLLQSLIKIAAAAIKIRQGQSKASRSLLTQSSKHLTKVMERHTETYAGGLHLAVLERWCRDFRDEVGDVVANPKEPVETVVPPLKLFAE